MYKNTEYNPSVNIPLNPGIYIFDDESATGKTRLCKHLKKLHLYGEPVDSFTYNDLLEGKSIEELFKPINKVVLIDRYDLYKEIGYDIINRYANTLTILIDCKTEFLGSLDVEYCYIEMTEDNIEVDI